MDQTAEHHPSEVHKKVNYPLLTVAAIIIFGLGFLSGYVFRGANQAPLNRQAAPTPTTPVSTIQPSPTVTSASQSASAVPSGWLTYKNETYGFEISYPKTYKALTSKSDLYGWPDAVVLLYNGGQSYDIAIEVWDSKADYEKKYSDGGNYNLTVKQAGNKYITILNSTNEPDSAEILSTFKFTN